MTTMNNKVTDETTNNRVTDETMNNRVTYESMTTMSNRVRDVSMTKVYKHKEGTHFVFLGHDRDIFRLPPP